MMNRRKAVTAVIGAGVAAATNATVAVAARGGVHKLEGDYRLHERLFSVANNIEGWWCSLANKGMPDFAESNAKIAADDANVLREVGRILERAHSVDPSAVNGVSYSTALPEPEVPDAKTWGDVKRYLRALEKRGAVNQSAMLRHERPISELMRRWNIG